ncbi:hypothetical protein AX14_005394 [Amanita brunnescens Koide BX004]|nr:hypothetical protein AX14_005394 [Amanita brunnescens Koide BX004]
MAEGPAVEQALALYSSEEGKERRTCVTVINIQRKCEDVTSPEVTATVAPPVPPVLPVEAATPRLTPDEVNPHNDVVLRQCEVKTTAKQSSEAMEGRWLARAATYIRE